VQDAPGDDHPLPGAELHGPPLEVEEEEALQDEEQLVLPVVFVPVELPEEDPEARDGVVHAAERAVPPGLGARVGEPPRLHHLQGTELHLGADVVGHGALLRAESSGPAPLP
jgi:hypothetical protein